MTAVAFAFASAGGFEVVAETVRRGQPLGVQLIEAVVCHVLREAGRRGALVEFDGHETDPHLYPVLLALPHSRANPVDLFEFP